MKPKKLKEKCSKLFNHFGNFYPYENTIWSELYDLVEKDKDYLSGLCEADLKRRRRMHEDHLSNFRDEVMSIAFSYGYVIGSLLEPGEKEIKEAEEAILEHLKEKELLPFFPKMKAL